MFVYLAPLKDKEVFKIGKSGNPQKRIADLSTFYLFNNEKILLVNCGSEKEASTLEHALHKICRGHNVRLENIDGVEFFSNVIYEKALDVVKAICDMNLFHIQPLDRDSVEELNKCCNYSDLGRIINSLGMQVKRLRIRKNLTQNELADKADVALNVIKKLECGKGVTMVSMIRVLVVLGKTQWLDSIAPIVSISPLDMLRLGKERVRVSHKTIAMKGYIDEATK